MTLKEIKAKILKGEALTEEEKAYLEKYEEPDTNAAAASARKAAEAEAKKRLDDLQKQLEEKEALLNEHASKGMSDTDKLQKQIDALNKKIADKEKALADKQNEVSNLIRTHHIDRIVSRYKLIENCDPDMFRLGLTNALKDVEDLTDESAIKDGLAPFLDKNKGILVTGNAGGTGSRAGGVGGGFGGDKKIFTHAEAVQYLNSAEKGSKERKAIREELFRAEAEGRIKKE